MNSNYFVAKEGPKVEFKIVEGAEMLQDLEDDLLEVTIEYFSGDEETAKIGSVHFNENVKLLTEGYVFKAERWLLLFRNLWS